MHELVALVIPVHGQAKFIESTFQSIKKIQYENLEIIVVLDRPSSQTFKKVQKFSLDTPNTRVLVSDQPGIVAALNLGIDSTRAKYIARLDADDLISPDRIELQVKTLEEQTKTGVVGTQLCFIDDNGHELGHSKYPVNNARIRKTLPFNNCIAHPSVLFRRDLFIEVGKYRKFAEGAEDYDLWIRLIRKTRIVNLPMQLTNYRRSANQVTSLAKSEQFFIDSIVRLSNLDNIVIQDFVSSDSEFARDHAISTWNKIMKNVRVKNKSLWKSEMAKYKLNEIVKFVKAEGRSLSLYACLSALRLITFNPQFCVRYLVNYALVRIEFTYSRYS